MSGYAGESKNRRILALFDVDGTLTEPRKVVSQETLDYLQALDKDLHWRCGRL